MFLQIECELTNSIEFLGQFFIYESLEYSSDSFPEIPVMPNIPDDIPTDINPELLFKPGMGSPLAVLTEKSILFHFSKSILDNQLKLKFGSLLDFTNKPNGYYDESEEFTDSNSNNVWDEDESFKDVAQNEFGIYGKLITFGAEYNLSENVLVKMNLSKIIGSEYYSPEANYQFNLMEDFSNFRMDIKYSF